jgi:hypothetical protein
MTVQQRYAHAKKSRMNSEPVEGSEVKELPM